MKFDQWVVSMRATFGLEWWGCSHVQFKRIVTLWSNRMGIAFKTNGSYVKWSKGAGTTASNLICAKFIWSFACDAWIINDKLHLLTKEHSKSHLDQRIICNTLIAMGGQVMCKLKWHLPSWTQMESLVYQIKVMHAPSWLNRMPCFDQRSFFHVHSNEMQSSYQMCSFLWTKSGSSTSK